MHRRAFLKGAGALAGWPLTASAQSGPPRRVGIIMGFPAGDRQAEEYVQTFRQRLHALGWSEPNAISIDLRWAGGDPVRTRQLAREVIAQSPAVILTSTNQVTAIVRQETASIPIVFASLGDPVGSGLVQSLGRPGGNVTGFPAFVETIAEKWLEILREAAPRLRRVGFVVVPEVAPHRGLLRAAQGAAPRLELELAPLAIRDAAELGSALKSFGTGADGGFAVCSHAVTYSNRQLIADFAAEHRLPTIFGDRIYVESGGLLSYGSDAIEFFRGAAGYVDLILKGAKPAELPVQLPTRFDLIINQKVADRLGLDLPRTLLLRATQVIE